MGLFDITWSLQGEKLLPPILRDRSFTLDGMNFKMGEPENNYIEYILLSSPGHWKEFPTIGVNLWRYLNGKESPQAMTRLIKQHLAADVFKNPLVDVSKFPTIQVNKVLVELT